MTTIRDIEKSFSKLFDKGYEEGYKKAKKDFERPHGEWKPHDQHGLTKVWYERYKCSNCNEYGWLNWHFCPNCGSDNRPRENNSSSMIINGKYSENVEYGTRVEIRKKGGE